MGQGSTGAFYITHPPLPDVLEGLEPANPRIKSWVLANRSRGIKVFWSEEHSAEILAAMARRTMAFLHHAQDVASRARLDGERILEVVGPVDPSMIKNGAYEVPIVVGESAQQIALKAELALDPRASAKIREKAETWLTEHLGVSSETASRCLGALAQLLREGYNAGIQLARDNKLLRISNLARGGSPMEQAIDAGLGSNIHWEQGCKGRTCCWTTFDF
jgi:hypothetical protein